jgi:hypothetical protein
MVHEDVIRETSRQASIPPINRNLEVSVLEAGRPPIDHPLFVTTRNEFAMAAGHSVDPGCRLGIFAGVRHVQAGRAVP